MSFNMCGPKKGNIRELIWYHRGNGVGVFAKSLGPCGDSVLVQDLNDPNKLELVKLDNIIGAYKPHNF